MTTEKQHIPLRKIEFTAIMVIAIAAIAAISFNLKTNVSVQNKVNSLEETNQLLIKTFQYANQKTTLIKMLDKKDNGMNVDEKVKLANVIFDLCSAKNIPINIICGVIEVESGWNPKLISESNAKGLMQVLPSTARPYLRTEKIEYNSNILFDPATCATVGISYLSDLHSSHVEAGKEKDDSFEISLHSYFWGSENTKQLYGKKEQRENVPNLAYPMKVLEAAKKYKEMGL